MPAAIQGEVQVNWGNLLEDQLAKWRGGGRHAAGIAEYISNCDDSYRRLEKFYNQSIEVEIHSKHGRHIDRLVVKDQAEGMSLEDLESRFFQYFESCSGRERGALVTGRFGTGGKAYAIMNFQQCWITSVKNGFENKAWFKWDSKVKKIVKGYNEGGYQNRAVEKPNGTVVELLNSVKVSHELVELMSKVEESTRIRHVLKQQKVVLRLCKRYEDQTMPLRYAPPEGFQRTWDFETPSSLWDSSEKPHLVLRYFEQPLGEDSFIDISDGISSVADLDISRFDGRPFSKYLNGSLVLTKLQKSTAVRENRKGLEEGDDFTLEVEAFIKECVSKVVSEIEEQQRQKEKDRRLNASHEKMKELSKFLKKCDMQFRMELSELKKRLVSENTTPDPDDSDRGQDVEIFRKPVPADVPGLLIRGRWIVGHEPVDGGNGNGGGARVPRFIVDPDGPDHAVRVGSKRQTTAGQKKHVKGL